MQSEKRSHRWVAENDQSTHKARPQSVAKTLKNHATEGQHAFITRKKQVKHYIAKAYPKRNRLEIEKQAANKLELKQVQ